MTLIPMTQFVLEQAQKFNPLGNDEQANVFHNIVNYAKFLEQPLEKWMFVPVGDDGEVLEEPYYSMTNYGISPDSVLRYRRDLDSYNKSKERVLFEGFKPYKGDDEETVIVYNGIPFDFKWLNVEDLIMQVGIKPTLTETAIKQIKG